MGDRRGLVRIAALSGYQQVASRLGLDTSGLLRAAGLTPTLMAEPEQFVPAETVAVLLEESARLSRCPTFGVQMALERTISDIGSASVLVALQPTLDALLKTLGRYRNVILPIIAINIEKHEKIAVLGIDLALSSKVPHRQGNEALLVMFVTLARTILGEDWCPECTHLAYPDPSPPDRSLYRRIFGPHVQFNADFNGITIALADLDRPRPGADPGVAQHATRLFQQLLSPPEPSFVQRVRQALVYLLGLSRATVVDAAEALGVHPRTLQRRLEQEGVTFRELVHQTRTQMAVRYLANRNLSVTEVAEALGYSSTGAFSRWYRDEFGRPPTQDRVHSLN